MLIIYIAGFKSPDFFPDRGKGKGGYSHYFGQLD